MQLSIPPEKYAQYPTKVRADVDRWVKLIQEINDGLAKGGQLVTTVQGVARDRGVAYSTLMRKYRRAAIFGWESLINKAMSPKHRMDGLPPQFLSYWRGLILSHQRDTTGAEAQRKLIKQWRAWRAGEDMAIPGYDTCPAPAKFCTHPVGWSLKNLMKHAPSKYEKRVRRQGTMAAKELLPSARTTRVGLRFLEMVMFDDQQHDVYVNLLGPRGEVINRTMMRPLSFNALDLLSGCDFARGYKPIIWDKVAEQKRMLTQEDFLWFQLYILTEFGYRTDAVGTTFVQEHGTAATDAAVQKVITDITGGCVKFGVSGILGDPLMAGLKWEGQPRGNFKYKAARESWFRIFRERSAALPGPTGPNPKMGPEESYGLRKYNNMLLRAMEKLPEERRALLALPVLNFFQYVPLADDIAEEINRRIEHDIEGWEELGFLAHEVRVRTDSAEWLTQQDLQKLTPEAQSFALSLMDQPGHGRTRKLSPREVFDMQREDAPLKKLSPFVWNLIMHPYAHDAKVSEKHEIVIRDRAISPTPLIYTAEVHNEKGRRWALSAGEKIRVYVNPYLTTWALICEPDDSVIGLVPLLQRAVRHDLQGWAETYGKVRSLQGLLDREPKRQAAAVAEAREEMMRHNAAVIGGEPVTPEEHVSVERYEEAAEVWDVEDPAAREPVAEKPEVTDLGF